MGYDIASKLNWKGAKGVLQLGLTVAVFISDRHRGIAKWIPESRANTKHFFDIWHVPRSITKKLLKASKEKGCEIIACWIKGTRKHLYWCATSTIPGFGSPIVAKWSSFLCHVANKHSDHPNPLYTNCNHGELEKRKWIQIVFTLCKIVHKHYVTSEMAFA